MILKSNSLLRSDRRPFANNLRYKTLFTIRRHSIQLPVFRGDNPMSPQSQTMKHSENISDSTGIRQHIKVYYSTIRERFNKLGLFGRVEILFSVKRTTPQLRLTKLHLNERPYFCTSVLWMDETKYEMFERNAQQHVWWKPNSVPAPTPMVPVVSTVVER